MLCFNQFKTFFQTLADRQIRVTLANVLLTFIEYVLSKLLSEPFIHHVYFQIMHFLTYLRVLWPKIRTYFFMIQSLYRTIKASVFCIIWEILKSLHVLKCYPFPVQIMVGVQEYIKCNRLPKDLLRYCTDITNNMMKIVQSCD